MKRWLETGQHIFTFVPTVFFLSSTWILVHTLSPSYDKTKENTEMQQRSPAQFYQGTLLFMVSILNNKVTWAPCNHLLPDESKDLQVPSGLSMPSFMNCTEVFGLSSRLTPPTRAASQWPWRMAWKAFSKASKLEEQAVSMAVLGPGEGEKRSGKERRVD